MKSKSKPFLHLLPLLAVLAVGCSREDGAPTAAVPGETAAGNAQITIRIGKIGALAKRADIRLASLILTLSADGEAIRRDTVPLSGNGAASFAREYLELNSLKEWRLEASTADEASVAVHAGGTTFRVMPRRTTTVTLDLAARYSMLKADFHSLREGHERLELWVDGVKRDDSVLASPPAPGSAVRLSYDYLSTGTSHRLRLDLWGSQWGIDTLLYSVDTNLAVAAGVDASHRLTLKWVGSNTPPPGQAALLVTLGALATHTVEGSLEKYRWQELHPAGSPPGPLFAPKALHFDAGNNRLIACFPGNPPFHPAGTAYEVWVLTGANGMTANPAWIKLEPTGMPPGANAHEGVGYDAASNRLIVYGGCHANCSPALSEVKVLTHANGLGGAPEWITVSVSNPQVRTDAGTAYDSASGRLIVFGGGLAFPGTSQNDIRYLQNANGITGPSEWISPPIADLLPPRRTTPAQLDAAHNRFMIFGGLDFVSSSNYVHYNDYWVLQNANSLTGSPAWTRLSPRGNLPAERMGHSLVYNPAANTAIVFGGGLATPGPIVARNDLWVLSHANGLGGEPEWTEVRTTGDLPYPMRLGTAALDVENQRMILLGGRDGTDTPSNRVWVLVIE